MILYNDPQYASVKQYISIDIIVNRAEKCEFLNLLESSPIRRYGKLVSTWRGITK